MDLMEFQAKELFAKHGVATTLGVVAETPEAARAAAELAPRDGPPLILLPGGTLNIAGDLTLSAASTVDFEFGQPGVVGASIWDSHNRWLTIHGTDVEVDVHLTAETDPTRRRDPAEDGLQSIWPAGTRRCVPFPPVPSAPIPA